MLLADLPGNGHSPEGDRNEWTLAGFARAVERLARDLELRGLDAARPLVRRVRGAAAPRRLPRQRRADHRLLHRRERDAAARRARGPAGGLSDEQRERVAEGKAREQVASSPQQLKDAWIEQAPRLTVTEAALMRMLRDVLFRPEMGRPRDWGELEALTALAFTEKPVLAIGAELDRAIEPEAARRIAITAPKGELLMLEGCGPLPVRRAARALLEAVEAWLLRTAAGTAA